MGLSGTPGQQQSSPSHALLRSVHLPLPSYNTLEEKLFCKEGKAYVFLP